MSSPRRPNAKQSGGFDVLVTSSIAVPENPQRVELILTNNGANDISLKLRSSAGVGKPADPTAVANDGIVLKAGSPPFRIASYTGPVAAIAATATTRLAVTEL